MIHHKASKLNSQTLSNCRAALLISKLDGPLEVTGQDVIAAEAFAKKVGIQWEKVLRRSGHTECADIVLALIGNSNSEFLQGLNCIDKEPTELAAEINPINKFITVDAALSLIRRHDPDCDGSGNASQHISTMTDLNSDNKTTSAKKSIQQIDRLMESMDNDEQKLRYGYNWDAIDEAVIRNEKRLYMFKKDTDQEDNECEIVPKSFTEVDENDANDTQHGLAVRSEGGQLSTTCRDFLLSTNTTIAKALGRKRKWREKLQMHVHQGETLRGREPSNVGELQWTWKKILDDISIPEQQKLLNSYIHPEQQQTVDDECRSTICGALRPYGCTHLWEETFRQENDYLATSAKRKCTQQKAAKERAGTRIFEKKGGTNEETEGKANASKTKWTNDCIVNDGTSSELLNGEDDLATHQELRRWLEMDLGECAIEMPNSNAEEGNSDTPLKRILAFRSLELALRF
jgi:hypothetical protein